MIQIPVVQINVIYNDIELVPQSTNDSCWAATTATIVGFDEKVCIADSEIAKALNYLEEYQGGLLLVKLNPYSRNDDSFLSLPSPILLMASQA